MRCEACEKRNFFLQKYCSTQYTYVCGIDFMLEKALNINKCTRARARLSVCV